MEADPYGQAHHRVWMAYGPATDYVCIECGEPARDWALQLTEGGEVNATGRRYSLNVADYAPMCRSCHCRLDGLAENFKAWMETEQAFEVQSANGKKNIVVARVGLAEILADPIKGPPMRKRFSERGKRGAQLGGAFQRRRCEECGMESHAAGIGTHQRASGHTGIEVLPDAPDRY